MSPVPNFAGVIRHVRKHLGLTQQEFAHKLGVALPTISRWENKKHKPSPLAQDKVERFLRDMGKQGRELIERYFKAD